MRHALVIGNTDGIGLGLTQRLLAEGWTVTGLSRRPTVIEHDRYAHVTVDVTAPSYSQELAQALDVASGADLCVYAAGVGEILDLSDLPMQTRVIEVT